MKNVLILIDIQKEYTTKGRPFYLNGIEKSLENCKKILDASRKANWEIVHVQHSQKESSIFNQQTPYYEFCEGFEPKMSEKHFIKNDFSCYSSKEFTEHMRQFTPDDKIFVIGYNSVMCCLSTIEVGYAQGKKFIYIFDASLAKSLPKLTEEQTHEIMISIYKTKGTATLLSTKELLETLEVKESTMPTMFFGYNK